MEQSFRIFDFNVLNINNKINESESDEESEKINKDSNVFLIQIFGVNELGKTYSVIVEDFKPFFYVMVNDSWTINIKEQFLQHIKVKIGKYYEDSISECIIIKRKNYMDLMVEKNINSLSLNLIVSVLLIKQKIYGILTIQKMVENC